ncbi:MAG TPA: choice-of-anchor P family protein [Marmoricola sp.]
MLHTALTPRRLTIAVAGGMVAALTALPVAANASTPTYGYVGYVGGTQITAVGMTVNSDFTAQSQLKGYKPATDSNSIAKVKVGTLAKVGAITTDATDTAFGDGNQIVTHAKTAGVNLLNGLIKVDAVENTATASGSSTDAPTASITTTLVGLTIAGKSYPANVPANTGITIPGVASVVLNYQITGSAKDGAAAYGSAIQVTLLKKRGAAAAGAQVFLNPISAKIVKTANPKEGKPIGGLSYGSYVSANVGGSVSVESQRTASLGVPAYGTDGKTITNSTARANLSGVLHLGAIETTASGVQSDAVSDVNQTATVANVNLFNRLIHATAIGSTSHVQWASTGAKILEGDLQFVNLWIAGHKIPIDPAPNTTIHIAKLGTITLNKQEIAQVSGTGIGVRTTGLEIVLDTKKAGLPVGAVVQLAVSSGVIYG